MEKFVKGDVVVTPFPFSDLKSNKRRPALIIANLYGDDVIMCQITSKNVSDSYAISLLNEDFESGNLPVESNIRANRLFTADTKIIIKIAGKIKNEKLDQVVHKVVEILTV
ncbi:MAG: type II toxin-antitoxin system PemK/MazF family toxin [Desulfamplus sp.]|nr:type II toxin-antitoxin system PemK/MazF family toxin [Desulfamplus sp.]